MGYLGDVWSMYTPKERKNIAIYIVGIMLYKFGLEQFSGAITTLATDRFTEKNEHTVNEQIGILQGLYQAFQCVGSILIAPLIKRFNTRSVLAGAILVFALMTIILLITDAATGGRIRSEGKNHYGSYDPVAIFPVYCAAGISYGMVELIRRVIPRDIVGGHVGKLKRMDSIVHVFYEITGTIGAFASAAIIKKLGNNYSFLITPIVFVFAAVAWYFVDADFGVKGSKDVDDEFGGGLSEENRKSSNYFVSVYHGFIHFGEAVYVGAKIVFSNRKFIWLVPGYSFALVGHRYLENNIANVFAKQVLQDSTYQQIMIGGSNFGELLGALTVFFTANIIPTPIPFIRLDALFLLIVWYVPFHHPPIKVVSEAWKMAGTFIPISFGWAAGDVSLAAYIQSSMARIESNTTGVSALGAVMSFLYVTYIVIYAIMSPLLGRYIDKQKKLTNVHDALFNIGGVHFTVLSGIILLATLIPRGAIAFNPKLLDGQDLEHDLVENVPAVNEKEKEKEVKDTASSSDSDKVAAAKA